ncbi:MAG TPA: sugar porter family MFS transporter [Rubrobacteraceae bacterium]|jgi:MFS transporter, SP family, galactose:H+ symporter|nr:sugar porter family MFS transporter [Rubrobacteraceae bacterium]
MSERETGNSNLREGVDLRGSVSRLNVFIGGTAAIIGIIYGYDLGAIAAAILFLEPDLGLSTFMVSVVTATVVLGQLFGAFSAGSITNRLGRKRTMVGIALGYVIFAALQGVAPNEWFLIAARFLLGFTIGVSIVTAPAYIAESSPRSVRGSMIVTFQVATVAGIAVSYFVGAALAGLESWRLILSLSAIPALIVLFFVIRLPDTPRWYLMNGQREEALDLIRRVQGDVDPEEEMHRIEEDLAYEEKGSFAELFQGRFRLAGFFVVTLGFLVQITGINAIVYYSPTIIQEVGVTDPFQAIIVNGFIQVAGVVAVVVSFLVVDRWGRRPTLLTGVGTMVVANAILIVAFALGPSAILAFIGILLFIVGFNFGYGSLVWVYASESFPARLRTQGGSAMLTSDLLANFIVGVVFLSALGALGGSLTFGIFFGLAILSFIFIYVLAPETKGRQLEAIRHYWYNHARWPEEAEKTRT